MIIRRLNIRNESAPVTWTLPELVANLGLSTTSGQSVTAESCQNIHTAYRCINTISKDVAKMPLQTFISRSPGQITRLQPSAAPVMNIAWLLEISPNRYQTPLLFKQMLIKWLITYGNAYAWSPVARGGQRREIFVLRADVTTPYLDPDGVIWYRTIFSDGSIEYLPSVEVLHLIINSVDGVTGNSVIGYARETMGRQLGASETQGKFYAQGLNPSGLIWMNGALDDEARKKVRDKFSESMAGSSNAYRLAVLDNKVAKFEAITMAPKDAQFLESIQQNDLEIANFFEMPLHKLNMGKQSYESNEQQNLDYLNTTLDPYLVQFEQAAALKWLAVAEQSYTYFRFNRDVILRTDAKTRAEYLEKKILSGQMTPNEARGIEDMPAYVGGDSHYIPANMTRVEPGGVL